MKSSNATDLNRILHLFEKSHQLSITRSEYEELQEWTAQSLENKEIWNDFFDEEKVSEQLAQWHAFNSEKALQQINVRIKRRTFRRYAAIAASVLFVLSTGLYFVLQQNYAAKESTMTLADYIQPGKNKATLKFSDDRNIVLREDQHEIQMNTTGIVYPDGKALTSQNSENKTVRQLILSVPKAGKYEIRLEDGSHIWVNSYTELKFPETFKGAKYREIELLGEAYFEVTHNAAQPFRVKMGNEVVEVLGTSFNLSNYADDDFTKATLLSGRVGIDIGGRERTILAPGQQAVYHKLQKALQVSDIDVKNVLSWRNGDFIFENEHIVSLMKEVERWYDIRVIYRGNFKRFYFSGIVSRSQPLSAVLDMLVTTEKIKYTISKDRKEVVLTAD
jgi:transmembrane sensor